MDPPLIMRGNSKLDFSRLQIRGRSVELSTLMRAYEKCSCSSGEVAFVSGPRGSGKSMLIRSFLDRVRTDSPLTLCATAKFDKSQHFKGFSAITEAINGICEQILENNEFVVSLRPLIIDALGSEIDVLGRIVPSILGKLVPNRNPAQNDPNRVMVGTDKNDEEWNNNARILQCLQAFIKAIICHRDHPVLVVLVFEDLHWADKASVNLLHSFLVQGTGIHGLLFVGVYRDVEQDGDLHHLLTVPHQRVHLTNLCVADVGLLISDVTRSEPNDCMELAVVVHRKTSGCALSVVHFLRTIEIKGLISYSITKACFEWQLDRIQSDIDVILSESIRKKLSDQMQCLSVATQQLLKVAACLGFNFDPLVIVSIHDGLAQLDQNEASSFDNASVVYRESTREPSSLSLLSCLHNAVNDGILEIRRTDGRMKFCHSHCHSHFYSLVRDGTEKELLHWNIGQLLWRACKLPSKKEWMTVATVEQLNRGPRELTSVNDKTIAARLNLEAAGIMRSTNFFFHAAEHLQEGISLLDSAFGYAKKWSMHYHLTLNLHSSSAEVEYSCGNVDHAKMMVDNVLLHGRSLHCKLRAYHVLVNLLSGQLNFDVAANVGLEVIQAIGECVPVKMTTSGLVSVVGNLKRKLRRFTNDDLFSLPLTKNQKSIDAMKMLSSLVLLSWTMKRKDYFPSLALQMVDISVRDGLTPFSAEGFAIFGVVLAAMGDVKEGHRYGALGIRLGSKIFPGAAHNCRASFVYHGCLHHLHSPAHESLGPLHAAYNTGFERGDVTYALLAASIHSAMFYTCGLPVTALLKDSKIHCDLTAQYGQSTTSRIVLWSRHVYASLAGQSSDVLEGLEKIGALESEEQDSETFAHSCWARLNVAFMFGNWSEAEEMAGILRKQGSSFPLIQCYSECFLIGMTYAILARRTGKHSFNARFARNEHRRMHGWLEKGCQTCHPHYMLLSAELGTFKSSEPKTRKFYEEAIKVARRTGMTHLEAIGNERLGALLHNMGERHVWDGHVKRAHELYFESGALGKCIDLESRYGRLFESSTHSSLSTSHRPESFSRTTVRGKSMFTYYWSKSTRKRKSLLEGSGADAIFGIRIRRTKRVVVGAKRRPPH